MFKTASQLCFNIMCIPLNFNILILPCFNVLLMSMHPIWECAPPHTAKGTVLHPGEICWYQKFNFLGFHKWVWKMCLDFCNRAYKSCYQNNVVMAIYKNYHFSTTGSSLLFYFDSTPLWNTCSLYLHVVPFHHQPVWS